MFYDDSLLTAGQSCRELASSDSESSGPDKPLPIPESASVELTVHNSQPGLQVRTRETMNWTPIASRNRARLKGTQYYCFSGCMLVLALGYSLYMCTRIVTEKQTNKKKQKQKKTTYYWPLSRIGKSWKNYGLLGRVP